MDATPRAVVIGTGAGGLSAAAFLASAGFHVGGSLAPFEREGFTFDVGINYVGGCRPGQLLYEQLAALGLDASALFSELEPDGFDIYRFPDFEVRNCAGLERFHARLLALASTSLKDPSGRLAPPGCSTLEVTTFVPEAMFERWASVPPGARGAGYTARKEEPADRMLCEVAARFPRPLRAGDDAHAGGPPPLPHPHAGAGPLPRGAGSAGPRRLAGADVRAARRARR